MDETASDQPARREPTDESADPSETEPVFQLESSSELDDSGPLRRITQAARAASNRAAAATVSGSQRATRTVGSASEMAARTVGSGALAASNATASAAQTVGDGVKQAATATTSAAQSAGGGIAKAATVGWQAVGAGARWTCDTTGAATAQVFSSAQALVASDLSPVINQVVAAAVKGAPTIYDKAMDAKFLETFIGGNSHRLFDGGHTIWGALKAAHQASPDDTILQETLGAIQGLLRDVSTPRGLPLATWDKPTFDAVADSLQSAFGISKSWLHELVSYDAADLLGGTVGTVSVIFGWNRADTETFSQVASSMALSAALSTNPLLMPIAVVALGRAFHKAQAGGDYGDLADGAFKGALTSGSSLGAIALVGVAGGPAGVAMLAGITAGVLAQAATKNVELDAVCQFVKDEARTVMSQIAAHAVAIGDGAVSLAARAGSAVTRGATSAANVVGKESAQAGRALAAGAVSAGNTTTGAVAAAGRATADAARATGRAGVAATTAARFAGESVARRAKAFVDRDEPNDPEVDQPRTSDD